MWTSRRWQRLTHAPDADKEMFFFPHLRPGKNREEKRLGDRHSRKVVPTGLPGHEGRPTPVASDHAGCVPPTPYAFRSLDRQWIIPDNRLINQANPELWDRHSEQQVYLTAPSDKSPTGGPALTFSAAIPDVHHYNGRGGRVYPLWRDNAASEANIPAGLLKFLGHRLQLTLSAEDLLAYLAGTIAHPAFIARFQGDLSTPGLRVPLTADPALFGEATELGRTVIWLQTFGERMADPNRGRPEQPPRLPKGRRPQVSAEGEIPQDADSMPDEIGYEEKTKRLRVGRGWIENVEPMVWQYEVSGKQVILQWFSYRKKDRVRPIIGERRPPSPLGFIQPAAWLAEYTTELINLLNVIGLLVELEPRQAALLSRICAGPLISTEDLKTAGALDASPAGKRKRRTEATPDLFDPGGE